MAGDADERAVQPSMLARAEEIQRQIQQLSGRDLQLWSIGALVIVILTGGLLAILLPNMMWAQRVVRLEHSYVPQLFFGLISLILLFNIYILGQKLTLNATRHALIRELVLNERLENLSLIDPLTQLLNKRAVSELVPIEVSRANRLGSNLTFMAIDLDGFRAVNSKFGSMEGDHLLLEFSKILRAVFRGGDMVFRHGGDEFLIVMPETSEPQADYPVQRLLRGVEQWNLTHKKSYEMAISYGISAYVTGADYADALRTVDRKMYQKRYNLVPVF